MNEQRQSVDQLETPEAYGLRIDALLHALGLNTWAGGNIQRSEIPRIVTVSAEAFASLTAQSAYHRQFFLVPGDTGVEDAIYVCIKNDADAYEFLQLGSTTPSAVTRVRKQADESVNSGSTGATLQDDDELFFAMAANETVTFTAAISYESGTAPDYKFTFTVPAGGTVVALCTYIALGGTGTTSLITSSGSSLPALGFASNMASITVTGIATTAATPGNLQFQFAQNSSDAGNTTTKKSSYLEVTQTS